MPQTKEQKRRNALNMEHAHIDRLAAAIKRVSVQRPLLPSDERFCVEFAPQKIDAHRRVVKNLKTKLNIYHNPQSGDMTEEEEDSSAVA